MERNRIVSWTDFLANGLKPLAEAMMAV
jgi:hypothetical protein